MPKDYSIKQNTTFQGYTGLQAGAWNNISTSGAIAGGTVSNGNNYLNAEIGLGTAAHASVKAAHEFDIAKNMGLELSAGAKAAYSFTDKNTSSDKAKFTFNDEQISAEAKHIENRYGLQANLGAQMKLKLGKHVQLGAGVEGGVIRDNGNVSVCSNCATNVNIPGDGSVVINQTLTAPRVIEAKTRGYISPMVSSKVETEKFTFGGEVKFGGVKSAQITAAYKF